MYMTSPKMKISRKIQDSHEVASVILVSRLTVHHRMQMG